MKKPKDHAEAMESVRIAKTLLKASKILWPNPKDIDVDDIKFLEKIISRNRRKV